jgi:hypothetical protein
MQRKKIIIKVAQRLPVSSSYIAKYHAVQKLIEAQNNEIIGLKQSVKRLEDRNEEWAAEVRALRKDPGSRSIIWPVTTEDIIAADWTHPKPSPTLTKLDPPYKIAWVVPPMGPVSGGHADIFRTISYFESKGHECLLYFYDVLETSSLEIIKENLKNYSPIKGKLFYNAKNIEDCDAIFATNWHTAYTVFNHTGTARKYYYVQDFEPAFEPVGAYSTFAENTYRFGLRGITLGRWLTKKLAQDYGMKCDYFELGVNSKEYFLENKNPRHKILFYARPVTPRRGFELGVLVLELFHKLHPEYEINFVGWDTADFKIPFPYKNLGILSPSQLNDLYNQCAAGLVLSFTNMSLLPLEMLASGCRPLINDAEHTRMVSYAKELKYAAPSPKALADALYEVVSKTTESNIKEMSNFAKGFEWDDSNKVIEKILLKELSNL